jgi:hypothetical protein
MAIKAVCFCQDCADAAVAEWWTAQRHVRHARRKRAMSAIREGGAKRRKRGADDAHIVAALALLDDPPDVAIVDVQPLLDANGFFSFTERRIRINIDSREYQRAVKCGDCVPLAGLIEHEAEHSRGSLTETPCYERQLATLRRLGADPDVIAECAAKLRRVRAREAAP